MNHIAAIWDADLETRSRNESSILATIVHTQGSTYRKPGARMLITASGQTIGMLSGGCLEQDILAHCEQVFQTGEPRVVTYDTSTEEDIRWGFGLGCDGSVKVLLEVLQPDRLNPLACLVNSENQAIATVFSSDFVDIPIGSRLILGNDQTVTTDVTNAQLVSAIVADLKQAKTQTKTYTIEGQQVTQRSIQVLLEVIKPVTHLTIFGAGRDALPVVHLAKTLGWRVTVVDCRAQEATRKRCEQADDVVLTRRELVAQKVNVLPTSIVVIMTHNYYDDVAILESVLPIQPKYIGILGSRQRSQKLVAELSPESQNLAVQLHRPIGLDLGGEMPEEIALAIIAEIQAVLHDRQGIFLKHRTEPIHAVENHYV
jgi:xanthine dehydrogenase accessory factor